MDHFVLLGARVFYPSWPPLTKGRKLKAQPLAGLALLALFHPLLEALTRAIGAWTVSSALFFFGQLFLLAICLNYAVRLSRLSLQVKGEACHLLLLSTREGG